MSFNSNWERWIRASCAVHFDALRQAVHLHVEGEERFTDDKEQWFELRVDFPRIRQHDDKWYRLYIEMNILCTQVQTDNIYALSSLSGIATSAFTTHIPVKKFGPNVADDESYVGCLTLSTEGNRDQIQVATFGKVRPDTNLSQTTVEGKYYIDLQGD